MGVVGGEEDGVSHEINEKLYTTVGDGLRTVEVLGTGEQGRYLTALTFGNVHGVYKPGSVKLRPEVLKDIQQQVGDKIGKPNPFDLVFHGGSGSTLEEIQAAVDYGVVKMNIDTDTQYAFTRPAAGHMFANYDGVLKVDDEVGNKKAYDPRAWGKARRGRHGQAHRRGLRAPAQHRHLPERVSRPRNAGRRPCASLEGHTGGAPRLDRRKRTRGLSRPSGITASAGGGKAADQSVGRIRAERGYEHVTTVVRSGPAPLSRVWTPRGVIAEDLQGEDLGDVLEMHSDAYAWWVLPKGEPLRRARAARGRRGHGPRLPGGQGPARAGRPGEVRGGRARRGSSRRTPSRWTASGSSCAATRCRWS